MGRRIKLSLTLEEQMHAARMELRQSHADIARFLAPKRGIAYVGSVDKTEKERKFATLRDNMKTAYVNPRGGDGGDSPVFASVLDLPDEYETVVVRTAAQRVIGILEDCAKRGIRDIVVFSSGYSEGGEEGVKAQRELAEAARRLGVRLVGPNTNDNLFWDLPVPADFRGRPMALITQSGAGGRPVLEGRVQGAAVKRWVATGNEADLDVADFIHHFAQDDSIGAIAIYVEGFKSIPKLRAALEMANRHAKPIVALKIGATAHGAKMAATHTGHLSGAEASIGGLLRQYGVVRVRDIDQLMETANLFCKLLPDTGPRAMMYTYSGGVSTLMGEVGEGQGVPMPELAEATKERLREFLPEYVGLGNPMDNGALIMHEPTPVNRYKVMDLLAADPNIDMLVFGINTAVNRNLAGKMCADLLAWSKKNAKPIVGAWVSPMTDEQGFPDLVASGAPVFRSFTGCFAALRAFEIFRAKRERFRLRSAMVPALNKAQAEALARPGALGAKELNALFEASGVTRARQALAATPQAALEAARRIGFPVAIKLASPDFPHKTEFGLVRTGVREDEVLAASQAMLDAAQRANPAARIEGIQVQEMIGAGVEMIIGLSQDAQCGPCLTIGMGGIHAELLRDATTRPLPVDEGDVREMIGELRLAAMLDGVRGAPACDHEALVRLALAVARLGVAAGERIAGLDLNPVIVRRVGAVAVDALVLAAGKA